MMTLLSFVLICNLVPMQAGMESGSLLELEGPLQVRDDASWLVAGEVRTKLTSQDDPILETLRDPRLSGRRLRVKGRSLGTAEFDVREFFVVRDGRLFRLVYFCEVCNITSFRPGDCDCCREPTEPVEIPPTDPRVYHPDLGARPPK